MLNIEEIKQIIPHRYPFLLIDRVEEMEVGKSVHAVKCITASEPWFTGHFPDHNVMPGVLLVEAMAQAGAVSILSMEENRGKLAFFSGIKNAKFRREVVPVCRSRNQLLYRKVITLNNLSIYETTSVRYL